MLSFDSDDNGKAVAVVCEGEYDDKIIYIKEEKDEPDRNLEDEDVYDILDDEDFRINKKYKMYTVRDRNKLTKSLRQGIEPLDEYLINQYDILKKKINDKLKKELELNTGTMIPIPDEKSERIYVAAKAGAGKSRWAALYAKEYHDMYPKKKIYIFTKHENEKAYQIVPHIEITHDNEILQNPIDITKLSKSLVIFDDCDYVQDKYVEKNLRNLNDDLITAGRKYDIYVLTLQHQLMNYKSTRNILNESNKVVFFNSSTKYHITRYLKTYVGLSPDMIKKVNALKSRWTMICLETPSYILHEHGIFII